MAMTSNLKRYGGKKESDDVPAIVKYEHPHESMEAVDEIYEHSNESINKGISLLSTDL